MGLCYSTKFNYDEASEDLGVFECCPSEGGYLNTDLIVDFHAKYNFEDNIFTILNIKLLQE
jgi:hypothetical protein